MTDTFFADIAKYQHVVDADYPHPMLTFRADSGFDTDPNAEANWAYCHSSPKIQVAIAYVVFIPGATAQILSRIKLLFGAKAPAKLAVMVDMESGTGFAGPGNHSTEANAFVAELVTWTGNHDRVIGYANKYDWADNWPGRPAWMRRVTAAYGTTDPGTFGWQYYGGVATNPSPNGYPRSCPPFGTSVDMNVIHLPIDQIVTALGLAPEDDMSAADVAAINAHTDAALAKYGAQLEGDLVKRFLTGPDGKPHLIATYAAQVEAVDRALISAGFAKLEAAKPASA